MISLKKKHTQKNPKNKKETTPIIDSIFSFSFRAWLFTVLTYALCLTNPFTTVLQLFYSSP